MMTLAASGNAVVCVGAWTFDRSRLEAVLSAESAVGLCCVGSASRATLNGTTGAIIGKWWESEVMAAAAVVISTRVLAGVAR